MFQKPLIFFGCGEFFLTWGHPLHVLDNVNLKCCSFWTLYNIWQLQKTVNFNSQDHYLFAHCVWGKKHETSRCRIYQGLINRNSNVDTYEKPYVEWPTLFYVLFFATWHCRVTDISHNLGRRRQQLGDQDVINTLLL